MDTDDKGLQITKENEPYICLYSGGKDSGTALSIAMEHGKPMSLIHYIDDTTGYDCEKRIDVIKWHADAIGVPLEIYKGGRKSIRDLHYFAKVIEKYANQGAKYLVTGNIYDPLAYKINTEILDFYSMKLKCPLWGMSNEEIIENMKLRNIESVITQIDKSKLSLDWLGKIYNYQAYYAFRKLNINPFGDEGEFDTTLINADFLKCKMTYQCGDIIEVDSDLYSLDLSVMDNEVNIDNLEMRSGIMVTPRFEFSQKCILDNYYYLKNVLSEAECYYALKANANKEVLNILKHAGSNFDAASYHEFKLLVDLGISVNQIIFSLPIKPRKLIEDLAELGCTYFTFDSLNELMKLEQLAVMSKKVLRVYITDILERCIPYGMFFEEIMFNLNNNNFASRMDGISFHITTNNNIDDVLRVLERVELILKRVREERNTSEFILNIGGGYPTKRYEDYFVNLNYHLSDLKNKYNIKILFEPGRSVVNSAGKYIAEIIKIDKHDEYFNIYIDGGDPHGISYSQNIRLLEETSSKTTKKICRVIGMTCKHEILGVTRMREDLKVGQYIVFDNSGAYTLSERSDFHLWPAPEIIVY